ncbi:hypothetical protein AVEN_261383-1 [Araneus ventricosus]|uniref:Uncharacterized protein n=1 Tax=Araneus ventricosus TaxID=182803 RepID=A0A4Y2PF06_ARAVE|nr:hypothetical protein AVEN_261383-1 [Araneus ventricosus]
MWFYNFGVHIVTESQVVPQFFTWTEDVASRGSTEVASSLLTLLEFNETLRRYFKVIEYKFPEVGHSYLDSDFGRINKNLRKHETIFRPEKYREIVMKSGRNHYVTDMTAHIRNFKDLHNKLQLTNRKRNFLNEKVAFRDSVKWIRVEEFGSYLYKYCYDPYTPFKKVDLRKHIRGVKQRFKIGDFELKRTTDAGAKLTAEKIENIEQQLLFIKKEYDFFYESVIQKEKQSINTLHWV